MVKPLNASIVDAVEKMVELGLDDVFDQESRRSLRSTCTALRQAIDPTLTKLHTWSENYSEAFWTSKLLDSCEELTIELIADHRNSVDPDVVVASLANAELPQLKQLELRLKCVFFGISSRGSDFSVFDDLHFEECCDLSLNHSSPLGTSEAFWRCMGRCENLKKLNLRGTDVSEADFAQFLADQSTRLEELDVTPMLGPSILVFVFPSVVRALAGADMQALRSVSLGKFVPSSLYDGFLESPWLQNVDTLKLEYAPADGMATILSGASRGSLRVLHAGMAGLRDFNESFEDVNLPNLTEMNLWCSGGGEETWDASSLFSAIGLPNLEQLRLFGSRIELIIPGDFCDDDVLPSLRDLSLRGMELSDNSADALGERLPRLTRLSITGGEGFMEGQARDILESAADVPGDWALESLELTDSDYAVWENETRPATLHTLEALLKAAPRMPNLKKCLFSANGVGLMGAWAWAAHRELLPQLEEHSVGDMGVDGLEALAENLGGFKSLKKLIYTGRSPYNFDAAAAFPGVVLEMYAGEDYEDEEM